MPDGSQNTVRVRIVLPEAYILIKAFALDERQKEKDAYDIHFILRNYPPDVEALAAQRPAVAFQGSCTRRLRNPQSEVRHLGFRRAIVGSEDRCAARRELRAVAAVGDLFRKSLEWLFVATGGLYTDDRSVEQVRGSR